MSGKTRGATRNHASIQAGDLDQIITFEHLVRTPDGVNGWAEAWQALAPQSWARVHPIAANEVEIGGAERAPVLYLITIHARSDIDHAGRIQWAGRQLQIIDVRPSSVSHLFMDIKAEAGAGI